MNRLSVVSCLSLVSALVVGCASPTEDPSANAAVDDAELRTSATTLSTTYEGAFRVRGASYGVKVTYSYPSFAISSQTLRATNFHRTVGFCDAFMEPVPVTARTVVTDPRGAVIADETSSIRAEPTQQFHADRATRCGNGWFAEAVAAPSLPAFVSNAGVVLTLDGEAVALPMGGYTPAGFFGVEATASFRALTDVRSERRTRDEWNSALGRSAPQNSETLTVDRGVVTLSFPPEMHTRVGLGKDQHGFATTLEDVVLRAR